MVNVLDDQIDPAADVGVADHLLAHLDGLTRRVGQELRHFFDVEIEGMRGSYGALLDVLPAGGARPSDLATALRISKQAVGQRLVEMEDRGWVVTTIDPHDGRARIVTRTTAGDEVRATARRAIASFEADLAARVGVERYATFRAVLADLAAGAAPAT